MWPLEPRITIDFSYRFFILFYKKAILTVLCFNIFSSTTLLQQLECSFLFGFGLLFILFGFLEKWKFFQCIFNSLLFLLSSNDLFRCDAKKNSHWRRKSFLSLLNNCVRGFQHLEILWDYYLCKYETNPATRILLPPPSPFFDYFTQNTHQNYVNIKVFWMIIEKIINKKKNPYTSAFYCLRIWIPDPDSHNLNLINKTHGWCRRQNWGLTCITAFVVESGIAWYPLL